jgi:hypothetical protein
MRQITDRLRPVRAGLEVLSEEERACEYRPEDQVVPDLAALLPLRASQTGV